MGDGYFKTAKAYILYREKRRQARATKTAFVDVHKTMKEYIDRDDWRVNANANQGYSLGGLILNASGKLIANYWLNSIYSERVRNAPRLPRPLLLYRAERRAPPLCARSMASNRPPKR